MMIDDTIRTPWHLWLVGIAALLFNAIGPFDFTATMIHGADYLARAGMTPAQIEHYQRMPGWMTAVWGIGVWTALAGAILLLLRNRLAFPAFAVSLAAFLLSLVYTYGLTDGGAVMGSHMTVVSAVIAAQLAALILYARAMTRRGVLR